jgi:hypothetical protein
LVQEEAALEARAVPLSKVYGTILERIVYKALRDRHINFDFQCLAGHHRVLTADLRWKPISGLETGDQLINFDENGPRRCFRYGEVLSNEPTMMPAKRVILSNGDEFVATEEHPWLANWQWRTGKWRHGERSSTLSWLQTCQLHAGIAIPKILSTWDDDISWESGYLAGFFDGEGSLVQSNVVAVEDAGRQDIFRLAVTGQTYIADGYGMHNSSLAGGRAGWMFGRQVADFALWQQAIVIECQGAYWHSQREQKYRDLTRELVLGAKGWTVLYLNEDVIENEQRLDVWLDRNVVFGKVGSTGWSFPSDVGV